MKKSIFIFSFISLLLSCSDNSNEINEKIVFDLDKEFIVNFNGFYPDSIILTRNYPSSYPSQTFDKDLFINKRIFEEVKDITKSYSLIFDFLPIPYVEEVKNPQGFLTYNKVLTNAMNSEGGKIYINSNLKRSDLISYGIYSTPDKAMSFLKDYSLSILLEDNNKKYMFLAKIISSKFDVLSDINLNDYENILYINSLSFGRYAYISIPTDDPEYVIDVFKNGILKGDTNYVEKYINISTSVNIIETGGVNSNLGYLGLKGFHNLINIFNSSTPYTGTPIYFKLKDPSKFN